MTQKELKILIAFSAVFMVCLSIAMILIIFAELVFQGALWGLYLRHMGIIAGCIGLLSGGSGFSVLVFFISTRKELTVSQQELVAEYIEASLRQKLK